MQDSGFTIRSMAERCGMTAHTLRYYERVGLIQPVGRARNGHRRYSEADAAWVHGTRSVGAHAEGTVGGAELGDAHARVAWDVEEINPADERDLLVRREESEQRVYAPLDSGIRDALG